jgi:hypothetical protein
MRAFCASRGLRPPPTLVVLSSLVLPSASLQVCRSAGQDLLAGGRKWIDVLFAGGRTDRRVAALDWIRAARAPPRPPVLAPHWIDTEETHLALDASHILLNLRRVGPLVDPAATPDNTSRLHLPLPLEIHRLGEAAMRVGLVVSEPADPSVVRLLQGAVDFLPLRDIPAHLDALLANRSALLRRQLLARKTWRLLFTAAEVLLYNVAAAFGGHS